MGLQRAMQVVIIPGGALGHLLGGRLDACHINEYEIKIIFNLRILNRRKQQRNEEYN